MRLGNKGFTLVEVLAVIVIIAVLGGIAIPGVLSSINTSKDASYNIMISNIVSASQSLYEEVDSGIELYQYTTSGGKRPNKVTISNSGSSNYISTNLQTLVSNGFLAGSNNDCSVDSCSNKNKKILLDPKSKKDIGACEIKITRENNGDKVDYKVSKIGSNTDCPTSYEKEVK